MWLGQSFSFPEPPSPFSPDALLGHNAAHSLSPALTEEQAINLGQGPGDRCPEVTTWEPVWCPLGSVYSRLDSPGSAASPHYGSFLMSWADTPNYYLERFEEAQLIDYIFPSLTGHLFGLVFFFFSLSSPARLMFLGIVSVLWGPWD